MLNAVSGTTKQLASAGQATRETHMRDAGSMNASQIQNVPTIWHVGMKNVLTLVKTAQSMLTAQPETTEQYASVGLATQEILMAQFAAKVSNKTLNSRFMFLPSHFKPSIFSVQQFQYQRLNVQQTETVPAGSPVCRKNVKIPAWLYLLVPAMQSALFTTHFLSEQCPVPAYQVTQGKEMSAVRKSVSTKSSNHGFPTDKCLISFSISTVIPEPVGCQSDEECSRNEACNFGNCVNPCVTSNPCSSNAACFVENHKAQCKCPPGFTGDPFRRCVQSKSAVSYGWHFQETYIFLLFPK